MGWNVACWGNLVEYLNLGRDPGAHLLSCCVFLTTVEVLQQERPNPQSVMKSRRRIKRGEAAALLAAVREEGSGLGV